MKESNPNQIYSLRQISLAIQLGQKKHDPVQE